MKKIYLILLITFLLLLIAGAPLTMSHVNEQRDTVEMTVEITSANGLQTYFYDPAEKTAVLMNDITAPKGKAFVLPQGQNATLDLHGKTITGAEGIEVITIDGGNLTLRDTGKTGKITHNHNEGCGVFIRNGSLIMKGGDITQNFGVLLGGGVRVEHGGKFTLIDGVISENMAFIGGGVYVAGGQFIMRGGTITNNSASFGGGVSVSFDLKSGGDGQFTMMGGIITKNVGDYTGGGVDVSGHFTATGGQICHNSAQKGGDVFVTSGSKVDISGAVIVGDFAKD